MIPTERIAELYDIPIELVEAGERGPELRLVCIDQLGEDDRISKTVEEGTLYSEPHYMPNRLERGDAVVVVAVRLRTDDQVVATYVHVPVNIVENDVLVYTFQPSPSSVNGEIGRIAVARAKW